MIEGDISKCFDTFNHKRLVSLVRKKHIDLQIFTDLLYKSLKAKVVSLHSNFVVKVGTPQGSVVSPILCNIYLHEMDKFIMEGEELAEYRGTKATTMNHEYVKLLKPNNEELAEAERVRQLKGKKKS